MAAPAAAASGGAGAGVVAVQYLSISYVLGALLLLALVLGPILYMFFRYVLCGLDEGMPCWGWLLEWRKRCLCVRGGCFLFLRGRWLGARESGGDVFEGAWASGSRVA